MKFKAPDGQEFSDKKEYREYMMEVYYSFKNKSSDDGTLIKSPGDIEGQVFDIADCSNCTMVVMDITDQVQIDNLTNCKVFIGACSSSLYIRNCTDCVFYTCSRQLRLRDITNSSFYSYCQSEIHIELSSAVRFGPFLGGYEEQEQHFKSASLDPEVNLWNDIYDHNDAAKTHKNWSVIDSADYALPWFPAGDCTPYIPAHAPTALKDKSQVGEAFSLQQMIADAQEQEAQGRYTAPDGTHKVLVETALMVVTAQSKDLNVSDWFESDRMESGEFYAKLADLAESVSKGQDEETRAELAAAVCEPALEAIEAACCVGEDEDGNLMIDVSFFLSHCKSLVSDYINKMEEGDEEGEEEEDSPVPESTGMDDDESSVEVEDQNFDYIAEYTGRTEAYRNTTADPTGSLAGRRGEVDPIAADTLAEYVVDLKTKGGGSRPQSAPAGRRGKMQNEVVSETFSPPKEDMASTKLPASPYDEQVTFARDEDDDEDLDSAYLGSRRNGNGTPVASATEANRHWQEENRKFLMNSTDANIPSPTLSPERKKAPAPLRPRPSSAPRMRAPGVGRSSVPMVPVLSGRSMGRGMTKSADVGLPRSASADGRARARNSYSGPRTSVRSSQEQLGAMKDLVEDLVRSTVKKADLYHMIQVSLGFIDSYTMVPPRGAIVVSRKRSWLSARDLQTAFISARLCLNEPQTILLRSLVHGFAQSREFVLEDAGAGESGVKKAVLGPAQSLSAAWLKKYLVHLRLTKKVTSASVPEGTGLAGMGMGAEEGGEPLMWRDWLGRKLQSEVKCNAVKPKEFEKALNGKNHPLSKEDVELMLKTYSVLPPEVMQQEVECRIESWLLDIDGRRDFQHELNVQIRRWIWQKKTKDNIKLPPNEKGYWQIWQRLPEDEKKVVKAGILNTIIQEKREDLLSQERTKQKITKELFWKFDEDRQRKDCKWSSWLSDHVQKFRADLEAFRRSEQARLARSAVLQSRSKTVAGLSEVQGKLKKAQSDLQLDPFHQIELQKAINALRRTALLKGVAKGTVITKEDFDSHMKGILAHLGHVGEKDIDPLFHSELKTAVEKVVELEKERTEKSKKGYDDWLADKNKGRVESAKKKEEAVLKKKNELEAREKKNKKEFKKWCNLRKKALYKSKVDNKPRSVPAVRSITHKDKWNNDKELHEYYAEMEKKL